VAAALLFEGELVGRLPSEEWDRPVSAVVTPTGWRDLG
jgi:5-formyltetrahydrofolate cyclo-ligase